MGLLVACKNDEDPIKNEGARVVTTLLIFKMLKGSLLQNVLWDFEEMQRIKKNRSKMKELEWSQNFPHYNPMGAICCNGNQSSDPISLKTLCSQSRTPIMLQMKFDYDRPAGLRDIHV